MCEQVEQGIIERVPDEQTGEIVHWIPHQPVIREDSESTKLRNVYDCSAKVSLQEPSLIDLLETGPPLQPLIFDILLKNRMHKYCIHWRCPEGISSNQNSPKSQRCTAPALVYRFGKKRHL